MKHIVFRSSFVMLVLLIAHTAEAQLSGVTLDELPYPFLLDGRLNDAVIVVGENAAASDGSAAVAIMAALQAQAVTRESVRIRTASEPTVVDGLRLGANNLVYGASIGAVRQGTIGASDLPSVLGKGTLTFKDTQYQYDQHIQFAKETGTFVYAETEDRAANDYLKIAADEKVYDFYLRFQKPLKYEVQDLERLKGKTLTIQNRQFAIADVRSSNSMLRRLRLDLKERILWLVEGQQFPLGQHTITVRGVDRTRLRCIIDVDGKTAGIAKGTAEQVSGVNIRITDLVSRNSAERGDMCEISLSDISIVLEDGDHLVVNGDQIRGSQVTFLGSAGSWEGLMVSYVGGQEEAPPNDGDVYIAKGSSWIDPVFRTLKLMFVDVPARHEFLEFMSGGSRASLVYHDITGRQVTVPFYYDTASAGIGLGRSNSPLLLPGKKLSGQPKRLQLLHTSDSGESHVLELTDISCGEATGRLTMADRTTGDLLVNRLSIQNLCDGTEKTIHIGGLGSVVVRVTPFDFEYVDKAGFGNGVAQTQFKNVLTLSDNSIVFREKTGRTIPATSITVKLRWSASRSRIEADVTAGGAAPDWIDYDTSLLPNLAVTPKGTKISWKPTNVQLESPENQVYAIAYLAPMRATISTGDSGVVVQEKVNYFGPNVIVSDEDALTMSKNMIVVGGPCANRAAAALLGNKADCTSGFTKGKGILRLQERVGKTALIVAGYDAADTQAAAEAIALRQLYLLAGTEMEVSRSRDGALALRTIG